jgi:hypothetical protein
MVNASRRTRRAMAVSGSGPQPEPADVEPSAKTL